MKIDTQGMTMPLSEREARAVKPIKYTPFIPSKLNVFTDLERKELKQLIREVLNEYI